MENLNIEGQPYSPKVYFDCENNILELKGESYPENAREFYKPVMRWLESYLARLNQAPVTLNVELVYFNSSTAKVLFNLFDALDAAARDGKNITINWIYDPENLDAEEYGEDFMEDLEAVTFNLVKKS